MQSNKFNIATDPIKITVIIPIYNNQSTLKKCIDSVINQTLQELQIICINDGSTDGSLKILKDYSNKDDRILILEQVRQNLDVARKAGLNLAFGEYVAFIEGNEFLDSTQLENDYKNASCDISKHNINYNPKNKSYDVVVQPKNIYGKIIKTEYIENNYMNFDNTLSEITALKGAYTIFEEKQQSLIKANLELQNTIKELKNQQEKLIKNNTNLEKKNNKLLKELNNNSKNVNRKIDKILQKHSKDYNKTKGQLRWARSELDKIRNSNSYRLGLMLTWLPRKIMSLFK